MELVREYKKPRQKCKYTHLSHQDWVFIESNYNVKLDFNFIDKKNSKNNGIAFLDYDVFVSDALATVLSSRFIEVLERGENNQIIKKININVLENIELGSGEIQFKEPKITECGEYVEFKDFVIMPNEFILKAVDIEIEARSRT